MARFKSAPQRMRTPPSSGDRPPFIAPVDPGGSAIRLLGAPARALLGFLGPQADEVRGRCDFLESVVRFPVREELAHDPIVIANSR